MRPTSLPRTPEGKVVLVNCATGQRVERWPVDARGMIASGDFTADTHEAASAQAATVGSPAPITPAAPDSPDAPKLHPLGGPVVATHSRDAEPGKPVEIPTKRTRSPKV